MYKLHGMAQSGNTYKVALILQALRQPWTAIHLPFEEFAKGVQRTDAWRQDVNPMGEIPVLEVGGKKLTQSAAIMLFLADQHGAYGGQNADERQEVLRWMFFDNHKFTSYFATLRFMKPSPVAPDPGSRFLAGRVETRSASSKRPSRDYIVGAQPTIADMSLCGYLYFPADESGYDIGKSYPAMAKWLERLKALPGWRPPYEMLPGQQIAPRW